MLPELDSKILYELGNNARITHKELAKKLNSKTSVISYHIANLEKDGIIWKYVPVISLSSLEIQGYKIYCKIKGLTKEEKQSLIQDLISNSRINWVAETAGSWDLLFSTLTNKFSDFIKIKNNFLEKYGAYVQEYSINILEDALVFNRDYLIKTNLSYRKEFEFSGSVNSCSISDFQLSLLKDIRNNGRFKATELAIRHDVDSRTILSNIRLLEKKGILQGYTTFVDIQKIGLHFFKLGIFLQDVSSLKELIVFCKTQKNVLHIVKNIGNWELEVELEAQDISDIYSFIETLKTEFPDLIKKIDMTMFIKEHKLDFFPNSF